jgi:peptidoglycan biosynthesis protein MviN/MurJ (putative lipid II flippase)
VRLEFWPLLFSGMLSYQRRKSKERGVKKMKKQLKPVLAMLALLLVLVAGNAHAAIDLTGFEIDLAPVETMVGVIVTAMGVMYAVRKIIKVGNRS